MKIIRLKDSEWADNSSSTATMIALTTFGILALELALIRWTSCQIRIFAYFNNVVLIGAFLGMGTGVAIGKKLPGLIHWTLPLLVVASFPLAFSETLGIVNMPFPDKTISLWGGEIGNGLGVFIRNLTIFGVIWLLIVFVFICAGTPLGYLFTQIPALKAYSADLLGSLLGIVIFTAATFFNASPPIWFIIGALPFVWLSRKPLSIAAFCIVIILGWYSIRGAIFSPYNRIDIINNGSKITLNVNRDFHQYMHNVSDDILSSDFLDPKAKAAAIEMRQLYNIPFNINNARGRALIVGAGTGNDVQGALRNGYREIYSVDIDREIIKLGKKLHPEKPYDSPQVIPVVNDARAFFEQYEGQDFDVVCYGFLDSHAMFSSMSSLRLDNFVYTEQGIRSAWEHINNNGHLVITISVYAGQWFYERLFWTIKQATGKEPFSVYLGVHWAATFIVPKDGADIQFDRLSNYIRIYPMGPAKHTRTTSDDWPFLYIRPNHFPWGYLIVLCGILIFTFAMIPSAFGGKSFRRDFDPALFFMGAAFLLIETSGVTSLSLLFGSTWLVNSAIFFGILTTVLAANLFVIHFKLKNELPWFVCLFISAGILHAVNISELNNFSLMTRGIAGGLLYGIPIGFAGIIVSIMLSRASSPAASLGSNLLGAVIGGCLEYSSMVIGLSAIVQIAILLYLTALLFCYKSNKTAAQQLSA